VNLLKINVRKNCCICAESKLVDKLIFEEFPIYMGVTKNDKSTDILSSQTWVECTNCGCLQLLNLLPLSLIYQSNHHTEVIGQIWREHHDAFAYFISRLKPSRALEIGAAHGYLAKKLTSESATLEYTIVEPDSNLVSSRIKIIKGFIEEHLSELKEKDCIIHSHVLEHVYKPVEFINQISDHIAVGTDMVLSFPNMDGLIKSGGLNSLNFEHTYLLEPEQAELIFEHAGFQILAKEQYLEHSYFYHLKKRTNVTKKLMLFPNISVRSREFLSMVKTISGFISTTNKLLESHKGPVYLFGAHVFSQSLIFMGLSINKISGVLDNSREKQNNRLYGTSLKVFDPLVISESKNVMVILNASHYQSEIRNQLISINNNAIIIENT
jgi:2-polyprenyl-3-methyl-5-hydroxy-6-metoxy-1,4-benzoquinol methylase